MREASGMRGEQRGIFRGRSVGSEGGWWWVASGVGGGTLSTQTEIAGGSLPSDLVLISPRISPFPLSHVILSLSLSSPLSSPFSLLSSYTPRIRVCLTLSSRSLPPSFLPSFLFLSFSIFPFCPVSLSRSPSTFSASIFFFSSSSPSFLSFFSSLLPPPFFFLHGFLLRLRCTGSFLLFARFECFQPLDQGERKRGERCRSRSK